MSNDSAYQSLLKRLKTARKKSGLNQSQLAEKLGHHQTYVSLVERGQRYLDLMEYMRWTQALDLDPASLITTLRVEMMQIPRTTPRVRLED